VEHDTTSSKSLHVLDAMSAAPDHHKVLLENDHVRVLDTQLRPGEQTPVHTHQWPGVLYVLSWSDFIRYDPDGKVLVDSRTMSPKPSVGASLWSAPLVPHCVRNVGGSELRVIAIELKSS
jgi:mannose-6-phosphate isomerase-like protein (cupin superfamily)